MNDFGYDISDIYRCWTRTGTMADLKEFIFKKVMKKGIKIILGFYPQS